MSRASAIFRSVARRGIAAELKKRESYEGVALLFVRGLGPHHHQLADAQIFPADVDCIGDELRREAGLVHLETDFEQLDLLFVGDFRLGGAHDNLPRVVTCPCVVGSSVLHVGLTRRELASKT
jgi:hypothetical protein